MPNQAPDDALVAKNRSASGGVNTFSSQLDIEDNQAVDLTNIITSVPGIRRVRPGTSIVATGATFGPVKAMIEFTPSSFTPELLIVTPGATYPNAAHLKLWKWDGTGGQFTLMGTLSGFTSATLPVDMITGLDLNAPGGPTVVRITNKQPLDYDWYYAGAGISAVTGSGGKPTTGMFPIGMTLDRLFGAGRSGASRGKVFYSDVASYCVTGMSASQAFTMGGGTRQEIVAIKEFRQGDLIIFMQDRVEALLVSGDPIVGLTGGSADRVVGQQYWSRMVIDRAIGCGSRQTVQTVGEDLFFLDQYGNVRSLQRTITDNAQGTKRLPVSWKIQSWIDRINPAGLENAVGAAYDRFYVISLPIDDAVTPSHTWVYDIINDAWNGPWTGTWAAVSALAVATLGSATNPTDKNPTLYIGGSETLSGKVYRSFVGTGDDGAAIVLQETTRRETYGTLEAKKKPHRVRVYALPSAGATMMIEARKDGGTFSVVGYASLAGESPQLPSTLPVDLSGSGVVEKVMTIEDGFQNFRDLQLRFTVTASADIQKIGHTTQAFLQNIDDEVN